MKYGFTIKLVDFDGEKEWVAESSDLKGCIGQGDCVDAAIAELEENEKYWLEIAEKRGLEIPQPTVTQVQMDYSGKLSLRLGKRVHAETAKRAKEEGLSINQYITNAVVSYNTKKSIEAFSSEFFKMLSMNSVSSSSDYKFRINNYSGQHYPILIVQGVNYA